MTESEWLTCTNPERMWRFCKGRMSPRKARLYAVACCRCNAVLLADERVRAALDAAERHADGRAQRGDGIIPRLAQAVYEERAFERLPVLADALEEAGCTDAAILDHCRSPGPHARGCWVVDLLLGRE